MTTRKEWCARYLSAVSGPVPPFMSPEWEALPDGPEKVKSVVRAALCWWQDGERLAERLAAELEAAQRAEKAAEDAEYVARRDEHRAAWTGAGFRQNPRVLADVAREWREWIGGAA